MLEMLLPVDRKADVEVAARLHIWHLVVAYSWTALLLKQGFTQDSGKLDCFYIPGAKVAAGVAAAGA